MLMFSLVLTIPAVSFADNELMKFQNRKLEVNVLHDKNGDFKKQEIPEEIKVQIKELKEKFKNGEINKEQFHDEMKKLFPNKSHFNKKCSFKELPEEIKLELKELKKKLINGEITEEQFQEEIDNIIPKRELPNRLNPKKFKKK